MESMCSGGGLPPKKPKTAKKQSIAQKRAKEAKKVRGDRGKYGIRGG
jgi:hypothetical protein